LPASELTNHLPALKYHPDRHLGKESEFNAKFQELQRAHEILSDPQQRAKYDADRAKAARIYSSFTSPTSGVPPTSAYSNFPPPPRRPAPPTASKTAFPKSPPSAGNNKGYRYGNFSTDDPWSSSDKEAKANAARAWREMKSPPSNTETGSFGRNTRHARANSFQTEATKEVPPETKPRPKSGWEHFGNTNPNFPNPGLSRANTMRVPKRAGFAPGTPGGDEPAARSSYFTSSREERTAPKTQTQYPPPPPRPPPTFGRPDPPRSETTREPRVHQVPPKFDPLYSQNRSQRETDPSSAHGSDCGPSTFSPNSRSANLYRMSTPYATPGGEKTYLSSDGVNASHHTRSGWPKGYTPTTKSPLSPPPGPGRHHSASPKMRSPQPRRYSSSGSSSTSEDEDEPDDRFKNHASARRASADHRTARQGTRDPHSRPDYLSPKVENAGEPSGHNARPTFRSTWSSQNSRPNSPLREQHPASQPGSRRPSASGFPRNPGLVPEPIPNNQPKRDAENGYQMPKSPLRTTAPWSNEPFEKPLEKSKSWDKNHASTGEENSKRQFERPSPGSSKERRPMYDSPEYLSSSFIPPEPQVNGFHSPKKQKTSTAWPFWAIPTSVVFRHGLPNPKVNMSTCDQQNASHSSHRSANINPFNSFQIPTGTAAPPFPRKAQSSESINTSFSPTDWHGKFNGNAADYLGAVNNGIPPKGRMSPPKGRTTFKERPKAVPKAQLPVNGGRPIPPPPPFPPAPVEQPAQAKFSEEQWRQKFTEPTWAYPGPAPMPSPRMGAPKRTKPPRKMSTATKRPTVPKPAFVTTANGDEEGDASNEASDVLESDGASRASSGNAMDIDPSTPPTGFAQAGPPKPGMNGFTDPIVHSIRSAVPPAAGPNGTTDTESSRLNMSDLKKEAPFTPDKGGLDGLDDLKSNLPFRSTAAPIPNEPSTPQKLSLPNPPRAPQLPDKFSLAKWDQYMTYMHAYMAQWNMYNKKMLLHFTTRQTEVESQLGHNWMAREGEEGYARYMKGLEEDFRVREHWDVSWEKHRECMKGLGKMRESAKAAKHAGTEV
jgi:curved DNA-binding protein CbpA